MSDHGHHDTPIPFSEAEIELFRKEDIHAGKAVVLLMTCIFSIGVILYSLVDLGTWPAITR